MAEYGMQLPGGRSRRGASPDVYTGLAFAAVVFLIAACVMMWRAAGTVGKAGNPFELQATGSIELKPAEAK